jgi:excinuclease UvrABC nuclease subunit
MVIAMLSAIPGVSDKTATALFDRFGSLQGIVDAVVADRAALSTMVIGDRKLGKVGQRIADAIL